MDLGFTAAWLVSGVAPPAVVADFTRLAALDPAKPPRHWRWLAVREFVEERERLTPGECRAFYGLGCCEPDVNLGTAIICCAAYQSACPPDVRRSAAASDRPAVRRAANLTTRSGP